MICPPEHRHGETSTCYDKHKCRCGDCIAWRREYTRRIRDWKRQGLPTSMYVDAAPYRERIQHALARGASLGGIARQTGVAYNTVNLVAAGRTLSINPDTADKLERLKGAPTNRIPAYKVRRRLEALQAIGYSLANVAREVGCSPEALQRICRGERESVKGVLARRVAAFYRAHENRPYEGPEAALALARARRLGFAVPAAWDCIDDPAEQPKGVAA